jgi:site-specific DNA recombinase
MPDGDGVRTSPGASGRRVARTLAANDMTEAEEIAERVLRAKLARAVGGQYMEAPAFTASRARYGRTGVMINRGRVNVVVIEPEKRNWLECAFRIITDHFQFFIKRV